MTCLSDAWAALKHGGLLMTVAQLESGRFQMPPPLPLREAERLRRALTAFDGTPGTLGPLLDHLLQELCGLPAEEWLKAQAVGSRWAHRSFTGVQVKPRRIWLGPAGETLPVFVPEEAATRQFAGRLGVGRSRQLLGRVLEWLRAKQQPLALVTNGRQWRLVLAGRDYDAWCEWDLDLWFDEGQPSAQTIAWRALLGREALLAPEGAQSSQSPLLTAISESRKGQADLSSVLGEQVREAVEELITASQAAIHKAQEEGKQPVFSALYVAGTRIIMRCIITLFAETRGLLPVDNPIYQGSYSLEGLRQQLDRRAGGAHGKARLAQGTSAWPRLLGLFRLIHDGSAHSKLPVPAYGGALFQPGNANSLVDPISRSLALLESPANQINDAQVHRLLDLLTRSKMKMRQGRNSRWVAAPVDFSTLSSEYIGILYEGLLDYELKQAAPGNPVIFLNIGTQPALTLSELEQMDDKTIKQLFAALKKTDKAEDEAAEDVSADVEGLFAAEGADGIRDVHPAQASDFDQPSDTAANDPVHLAQVDRVGVAPPPANASVGALPASRQAAGAGGSDTKAVAASLYGAAAEGQPLNEDHQSRTDAWLQRAAVVSGLVKKTSSKDAAANHSPPEGECANATSVGGWGVPDEALATAKRKLCSRIVPPGDFYLVRWGGTRKGAGTFYTRPQLAAPTVRRTLQPLAYNPIRKEIDQRTGLEEVAEWAPKTPEQILALKVCDPAMGSGSFLASALRYLTDALVQSLYHHGLIEKGKDGGVPRLADGKLALTLGDEITKLNPKHEDFEERLRGQLKRHIVERCLYGVDLDPLAVELGRMALWVETMDRDLPFGFLDHKLKVGNALVGAWFDTYRHYPAMAWQREGGDKDYQKGKPANLINHHWTDAEGKKRGDVFTHAIKERGKAVPKQLTDMLSGQMELGQQEDAASIHDELHGVFRRLHQMPVHEASERADLYRAQVQDNPHYQALKARMDLWCALWFWPGDQIASAPLPLDFAQPGGEVTKIAAAVAREHRFFHWELEYPDAFTADRQGFDAVVGNPPWDVQAPKSLEFFSNHDPLYRSYGKQEALAKQLGYFRQHCQLEHGWIAYIAGFREKFNWTKHAGHPFGDRVTLDANDMPKHDITLGGGGRDSFEASAALHKKWKKERDKEQGFADARHPFLYQGAADLNTYKMFLEISHTLLADRGRLGMVVPNGIYTLKETVHLRELFLNHCDWQWLFGFENREGLFEIDSRFKFCPIVVEKGGETQAIRVAFMRRNVDDWDHAEHHVLAYPRDRIVQSSPRSRIVLEIRSEKDLQVLQKIYANGVLLGDQNEDGWGINYIREFDMTGDSSLFPPRPKWEERGYVPDEYGHWLKGPWQAYRGSTNVLDRKQELVLSQDGTHALDLAEIEDVALPFYEGRMLGQFDFSEKGWVSGKARTAVWREIPFEDKVIEPQYLLPAAEFVHAKDKQGNLKFTRGIKLGFMNATSSTNTRTIICAAVWDAPCGHSAPVLTVRGDGGG